VPLDSDSSKGRFSLPNIITVARIAATPVLFLMVLAAGVWVRFGAFVLFVVAGLSDVWDGHLARKHGLITDTGKLLDPIADKLLMLSTFVPIYFVSQRPGELNDVPGWGPLPLWVLLVIFGRELFITLFRQWAKRKGRVIAAGRSGKYKTLFQSLFVGGILLWYPLEQMSALRGWVDLSAWTWWAWLHRWWVGITLAVAIFLTIYSMLDYLWSNRSLFGMRG
jgi:CDP-diacylglycerol--glycerol-3-phosphate 3-phosphatidyltransferase